MDLYTLSKNTRFYSVEKNSYDIILFIKKCIHNRKTKCKCMLYKYTENSLQENTCQTAHGVVMNYLFNETFKS